MYDEAPPDLTELSDACWAELATGAAQPAHAFHTGVLATVSDRGPEARTVVLRAALPAERALWFHTDQRSTKVRELIDNPQVTWVFWDKEQRIQLRCCGAADLHPPDHEREAHWSGLHEGSRGLYRTNHAPGTPLETPDAAAEQPPQGTRCASGVNAGASVATDRRVGNPNGATADPGQKHFLAVRCTIDTIDWLRLGRQHHHRARLAWTTAGWTASWLAP